MNKKPIINALGALLYIIAISLVVNYGPQYIESTPSVLAPVTMLSLLTLSVAVMGYFFVLQPLQLFLSGKKKEGVKLFTETLAAFAVITVILVIIVYSGILF